MRSLIFLLPIAVSSVPAFAQETVPVPAFQSVELRGGGDVVVRPGPVQRVTLINGSTQFTGFRVMQDGQLRIDACNERCPQHYALRIEIVSPHAPDLAIQGGGTITAEPGFAPQSQLSAAVDGGGRIDARSVAARSFNAAINGGGKIFAGRSSVLSAAVNGGGEVRYAGNPEVSSAIHGGGNVRPAE